MPELVSHIDLPKGVRVTVGALMPKIMCCIEGNIHKIYVGRECVRTFKQWENAVKKYTKVYRRHESTASSFLKAAGNPILSQKKRIPAKEIQIGFDYVI